MPELELRGSDSSFKVPKAIMAYGNKYLVDDPTEETSSSGSWNIEKTEYQSQLSLIYGKFRYQFSPVVSKGSFAPLMGTFIDRENPFTQVDLVESEHDQVQELIFMIRTSPSISCRKLATKLLTLFNDSKEDDPTSVGINMASLRNFYNFFQTQSNLKCPTISLTPGNNIYASWRDERNRVFSVHFLPSGDVHFVIFKPNDRHPERQIRLSGTATADILQETVSSYGVWDWISE